MAIEVNGKTIETDEEGYLVNLAEWNEDCASVLAEQDELTLTESHWEVINFLREYYDEYQIAPAVRVLTKAIGKNWGLKRVIASTYMSCSLMVQPNKLAVLQGFQNQPVVFNVLIWPSPT
jgi:tRNA 2-thiouridine synthesizing protein E